MSNEKMQLFGRVTGKKMNIIKKVQLGREKINHTRDMHGEYFQVFEKQMQLFPEDSGKRRCCKLFFEMAVIAECLPLNDTV